MPVSHQDANKISRVVSSTEQTISNSGTFSEISAQPQKKRERQSVCRIHTNSVRKPQQSYRPPPRVICGGMLQCLASHSICLQIPWSWRDVQVRSRGLFCFASSMSFHGAGFVYYGIDCAPMQWFPKLMQEELYLLQ